MAHRMRVRAVLLDGDEIVLFRRTRPGIPVYWAFPGGGVEKQDADLRAALLRELDEELRAQVDEPVLLTSKDTVDPAGRPEIQHLYACRLRSMDFANRHGSEFSNPAKGQYDVERVPFTPQGLADLLLVPPPLADYVRANIERIRAVAQEK
jgi:8-oxo-dGTP pyrophosphatase MutT (NUDIX family)